MRQKDCKFRNNFSENKIFVQNSPKTMHYVQLDVIFAG